MKAEPSKRFFSQLAAKLELALLNISFNIAVVLFKAPFSTFYYRMTK